MPELVLPDVRYRESFWDSCRDWGAEDQAGTSLAPERHDALTPEGFASWVAELVASEHTPP